MVICIRVESWSLLVQKKKAEEARRTLLRRGLMDPGLKIRAEGEDLLLPIIQPMDGAERELFETLEIPESPPRHEQVGGIAILREQDRTLAEKILGSRPSLHTVLYPLSAVEGKYRTRRFEVLAGIPTTQTEYHEYGHRYVIDLGVAYFSARLSGERQRILRLMEPGERVLDMFAGVGPFPVTLSEKAALVVACDINPAAVSLMIQNLLLNRSSRVLPVLADVSNLSSIFPRIFSRVIMNLPLKSSEFLDIAFSLCRRGGYIHFYALQEQKGEFLPAIQEHPVAHIDERVVRSSSPGRWHAVYDITVA
ncbi:MAG: methyltransferase [Methanomicrobiales archaeon]|nr:methyltransferase [Methanomicrobiales archaeon]